MRAPCTTARLSGPGRLVGREGRAAGARGDRGRLYFVCYARLLGCRLCRLAAGELLASRSAGPQCCAETPVPHAAPFENAVTVPEYPVRVSDRAPDRTAVRVFLKRGRCGCRRFERGRPGGPLLHG